MPRIDRLLVDRGLAESREKAQELISAGMVVLNGRPVAKVSTQADESAEIELTGSLRYVGRGGNKLEAAFERWPLDPAGWVCADVGASTGGFTDLLLQRGAARVYAIDSGSDQLHPTLRGRPEVVVMEKTNARYLEALPEAVQFAVMDLSFISSRLVLPAVAGWLAPGAEVWALVKPQFEAPERTKKGLIRDEKVRDKIFREWLAWAEAEWRVSDHFLCPVAGEEGNREYWARLLR